MLLWLGLTLMCLPFACLMAFWGYLHSRVLRLYMPNIVRIFTERPLFVVPRGLPLEGAEVVHFDSGDGLLLRGCYLRADGPRRGVILFGLEFGSDCWACRSYCEALVASGFDVFAYEPRNQGKSDPRPGYEPMQWVTCHEVRDARAALAYLKGRADADPRGVGLFGISKGAGAGLLAAADDPYVVCAVTDGMFATLTTLIPYMRQWFLLFKSFFPEVLIPMFYYRHIAGMLLRRVGRARRCRFPHLEPALKGFRRPLLVIHGEQDTYIKPTMGRALAEMAGGEFWLVEGAKHNGALHVAGEQYRGRVLRFFDRHLATAPRVVPAPAPREEALRECVAAS